MFVVAFVAGGQELPVVFAAGECLLPGLEGCCFFTLVEGFVAPCVHDACVAQKVVVADGVGGWCWVGCPAGWLARGRGGCGMAGCLWCWLGSGVGGQGAAFGVEDGLFVVRVAVDVEVVVFDGPEGGGFF